MISIEEIEQILGRVGIAIKAHEAALLKLGVSVEPFALHLTSQLAEQVIPEAIEALPQEAEAALPQEALEGLAKDVSEDI